MDEAALVSSRYSVCRLNFFFKETTLGPRLFQLFLFLNALFLNALFFILFYFFLYFNL